MQTAQGLAVFILSAQALSSILLALGTQFDNSTFLQAGITSFRTVPGITKSVKLFRLADTPMMQVAYLLSLIFVVFSYAGVILMVLHLVSEFLFRP